MRGLRNPGCWINGRWGSPGAQCAQGRKTTPSALCGEQRVVRRDYWPCAGCRGSGGDAISPVFQRVVGYLLVIPSQFWGHFHQSSAPIISALGGTRYGAEVVALN